jgi:hypothetical protein
MTTNETSTVTVTIDAPYEQVARELADAAHHPDWANEFFAGPARPAERDEYIAPVPMMGGDVHFRIDADTERGIFDHYLAPVGQDYGDPLPVRLIRNGDGADVLWTLSRPPGLPDEQWRIGLASMQRELHNLKARVESAVPTP